MRFVISVLVMVCLFAATGQDCSAQSFSTDNFLNSKEVVITVYFDQGSSDLSAQARKQIEDTFELLALLVEGGRVIRVEGFSSTTGSPKKNYDLSMERALTVVDYLEKLGLNDKIYLTGFGDMQNQEVEDVSARRVEIAAYENLLSLAQQVKRERKKVARP